MFATATFHDTYFGQTDMILAAVRTSRRGERVVAYRWTPAPGANGCITTGFAGTFASIDRAMAAASRHARFSNVHAS